ncbi:MAG: aspartate aminotransferase family protein [Planctomycetales bacterium]|nr:aspartate aminotransferase family protein [Planctomycetales bacterium]
MPSYEKSKELHERASRVLAGGVSSEFRRFSTPHPLFYAKGQGNRIVDVDGNEFLDFTLSQGPLILGHSHPEVLAAVAKASADGQLFAGQHLLELELAERLNRIIPCAELMRFSLSGSEADHAAIRVARAVTGRDKFLRFEGHYHGWLDEMAQGIGGAAELLGPRERPNVISWTKGLPAGNDRNCLLLPWNDLGLVEATVQQHAHELAAIITEPVMCNSGCIPPDAPSAFLRGLREICDRYDIALIFDEVITGFRLALGGAQEYYGVTPDLAVFGKAMASGYPISVLCGRKRFMQPIADGTVIHAGTMNSGQPSVAAALATLNVLERDRVHERLFALGQRLMWGLRNVACDPVTLEPVPILLQGPGPMFHAGFTPLEKARDYRDTLRYDKPRYARFVAAMQERGIRLIGRGLWYISAAHTEADVDHAISVAGDVFSRMADGN